MSENWKPGDVALISTGNGFDAVGLRSGIPSNMGWAYTSSDASGSPVKYGNCWTSDRDGKKVIRRLAVIDPEDREEVERLAELLDCRPVDLAGVLRNFANPTPPKPEEPTGLGAVVRDREGDLFVRHSVRHDCSRPWRYDDELVASASWAEVDAVEILAEGVTP